MILFLFTLLSTEDPYRILGLSKSATKGEIKKAYRTLSFRLHPDVSKTKDTQEEWKKVNDAYELLSNPDRKARYDRFGIIDDSEIPSESPVNMNVNQKLFETEVNREIPTYTTLATEKNFDSLIQDNEDLLFLVYTPIMCLSCDVYLRVFEQFNKFSQRQIKCVRVDVSESTGLAERLGAQMMPCFVYVCGNYKKILTKPVYTVADLSLWVQEQWKSRYYHIKSLDSFFKTQKSKIHVIQVVRKNYPTLAFVKNSARYRDYAIFGLFQDTDGIAYKLWNISIYPSVLLFKNKNTNPKHIRTSALIKEVVGENLTPIGIPFNRVSFNKFCVTNCLLKAGSISDRTLSVLNNYNVSAMYIDSKSQFAKALSLKEDDWAIVMPEIGYYSILKSYGDEIETIERFYSDAEAGKINTLPIPDVKLPGITVDDILELAEEYSPMIKSALLSGLPFLIVFVLCIVGIICKDRKVKEE